MIGKISWLKTTGAGLCASCCATAPASSEKNTINQAA